MHLEHLEYLKRKLLQEIKGIPINLPYFRKFYRYFEKGHRILLGGDTGTGKSFTIIKFFILDVIGFVSRTKEIDCKIYYFTLELNRKVILSRIYLYILNNSYGRDYDLEEINSPSKQSTIDDLNMLSATMATIEKNLVIIDSLHSSNLIYEYMKREMLKYGIVEANADGSPKFTYHNENLYVFCIVDTINAMVDVKTGDNYIDVKRWSEHYCKLYLSQIYEVICVNVAQFDNNVRTSQFANSSGFRVEEKHEPTLGSFGTVKSTPNDHTLTLSLFQPYRYNISKHGGYDITKLKDKYIRLNIMKNSFGRMGPDVTTHLLFEGDKWQYTELPDSKEVNLMKKIYDKCALYVSK